MVHKSWGELGEMGILRYFGWLITLVSEGTFLWVVFG